MSLYPIGDMRARLGGEKQNYRKKLWGGLVFNVFIQAIFLSWSNELILLQSRENLSKQ